MTHANNELGFITPRSMLRRYVNSFFFIFGLSDITLMHEIFARLGFVSTGPWIRFNLFYIENEKNFSLHKTTRSLLQTLSL